MVTSAWRRLVTRHGGVVEAEAWKWANALRASGGRRSSQEADALAKAVEEGLAADGADGLITLILAGPALGGLDARDSASLLDAIRAEVRESADVLL